MYCTTYGVGAMGCEISIFSFCLFFPYITPEKYFFCARFAAQGLHRRMLPVIMWPTTCAWPYHETVRMYVCLSRVISRKRSHADRAIVTMDHYIEVGCN